MDKNFQNQHSSGSKYMDFKGYGSVNHTKHRNLQKSKTLMRNSVKNPLGPNVTIKTVSGSIPNAIPEVNIPKESESKLDGYVHNRHPRNYKIPRSELISRFSSTAASYQESQKLQEPISAPAIGKAYQEPLTESLSNEEALSPNIAPIASNETPFKAKNIFEEALKNTPIPVQAENLKYSNPQKHKIKKHKKSHKFPVLVSSLSVLLVALIVGGIYVGHNLNRVSLYLASSRAGFKPTVSSYSPSGFDLSSVSSASGIIESSFKSNSDSRSYSVIEKKSNWNSNDLLNNYVIGRAGLNYQTINQGNLTIYTFNGNSLATWVHNGIWYLIQDNNSLSTNQIIEIATGM